MLRSLVIAGLFMFMNATSGFPLEEWLPQLGTTKQPKNILTYPKPAPGDVYLVDDSFYQSRAGCTFLENDVARKQPLCNLHNTTMFTRLKLGSLHLPKSVNGCQSFEAGDIFLDEETKKYYRASEAGYIDDVTKEIYLNEVLEQINVKSQWMTLMAEELGDRRLGDVIIPGTHDSATDGINARSYLVENNLIFRLAMAFEPEIVSNWSLTQTLGLGEQLAAGFREFDLRIADMEMEDGTFRWWHTMSGHTIEQGLDEMADFAANHPSEVVILLFQHFARPGDALESTRPIPERRKDEIAAILIEKLAPFMATRGSLSENPTFKEILATGGNLVVLMKDAYIRNKHPGFWSSIIFEGYSAKKNPEELFADRSNRLRNYKANHSNMVTDISAAATPGDQNIISGLILKYGQNETIRDIIEEVLPGLLEVKPEMMSFEGLFYDLLYMTRDGVNTRGMHARPSHLYGSGASVHYLGVNDMLPYWAARPQLYRPNIVYVDDYVSSTIVETAIAANLGEIPREVTVAHQGNSMNGYYEWAEVHAIRGNESLDCMAASVRYRVSSVTYDIQQGWVAIGSPEAVSFQEGQYPPDSVLSLEVSYNGDDFTGIYENNVQNMITNNIDIHIRSGLSGDDQGYAYISEAYNDYGEICHLPAI